LKILRFIWRALLGLVAVVLVVVLVFYFRDPAVLRRLATGPGMGVVDQTARAQPQEPVPGVEREDILTGPPGAFDPAGIERAEAYAAQTQSVALLVYHRGALRHEKYWPGYDADSVTDTFSAHKTVQALLVGAAIADGLIGSVDDPVAKYLPEFAQDERRSITIRHLLQMSSGLEIPRFGTWTSWRITLGSDLPGVVTSLKAEKPSGTEFQYANANAQLLGLVLQKASGKRYAQYLSERLWSRLGAPSAAVWLDREGGTPRTFCCIYTTARAWLRVGRLIMDQGRVGADQVIPAAWIRDMTTASTLNPNYGYQIWLGSPPGTQRKYHDKTIKAYHSEPFLADDIIYIDGFGGQRVYMIPSQELIIVRTGKALIDWDDAKIPNAILQSILPASVPGASP
jgi:CubicO group peptidase (beta-lactamase class C family)